MKFIKLSKRFGLIKGVELTTRILLGRTTNFRLPGFAHPVSLRTGTTDIYAFYQVFLNKEYEIPFASDPQVIIDGGANVGLFAILMKKKYPQAQIICVEPDRENFNILQKNVSAYDNIHAENCGLWNSDTKLKVYDKYDHGKWGIVVTEDTANGTVPAVSIGSLREKYKLQQVDVLKLDIETSEKQVFSSNFESWLSKTKMIIIELHDWIEPGCARSFFAAITKSFGQYKYSTKGENIIIERE